MSPVFICPVPCQEVSFPQAELVDPVWGNVCIKSSVRAEVFSLKTPALRHSHIRGHRSPGPHFKGFGMGLSVGQSNIARASRACWCA